MNKEMNEEEAINVLKGFVNGDLYILLSTVNANMIGGFSFPYVGQLENGKILFLFSDLDFAKLYCDNNGFEVLDGVYPLSKIDRDNVQTNLEMIVKIARQLGVTNVDFNPTHESLAFGVAIPWMQKVLDYDLSNISIIISEKEMNEIKAKNDGKMPLRFNPLPIFEYTNPYFISPQRRKMIDDIPLKTEKTIKEYVDEIKVMPLNELIYLSEVINRVHIAKAKEEKRTEDEKMFGTMYGVLDQVIIHILTKIRLYTLLDNGETFINQNKVAYILYTDRFKYMGEYRYQEITLGDFCDELEQKGINNLIITAGPGEMHLGSVAGIREYMRVNEN